MDNVNMRPSQDLIILESREQAGRLLANKLSVYRNSKAIVVGIPRGGVCVAFEIADALSLPLEVLPCREIKHPSEHKKAIGSVCLNDVFVNDSIKDIPQDYVYHQIIMLQHALKNDRNQFYQESDQPSFFNKTVILVNDFLDSENGVLACLRGVMKQRPMKIIVAVPLVETEAARIVRTECDDLIFLQMKNSIHRPGDHFESFPDVDDHTVLELLELSRKIVRA